jgi:hypothetical protein
LLIKLISNKYHACKCPRDAKRDEKVDVVLAVFLAKPGIGSPRTFDAGAARVRVLVFLLALCQSLVAAPSKAWIEVLKLKCQLNVRQWFQIRQSDV